MRINRDRPRITSRCTRMSAQKPVQSDDPIELLADSMNVWVGKLSDIVHKVIDTEPIRNVINWARMYSLWPVNITTACCSAEFGAASGARHDLERFGVLPYGSLRQSDLIVIEGTITKKIAMGDCAISGGLFHDSYSIVNGAHEFLPVDVYVPGCPPRPEALEQGIIMLQQKIRSSKVYPQS